LCYNRRLSESRPKVSRDPVEIRRCYLEIVWAGAGKRSLPVERGGIKKKRGKRKEGEEICFSRPLSAVHWRKIPIKGAC